MLNLMLHHGHWTLSVFDSCGAGDFSVTVPRIVPQDRLAAAQTGFCHFLSLL